MGKTLFVGDVHAKAGRVLERVDDAMGGVTTVVFLGDLMDDWDADGDRQAASLTRLADWADERRAAGVDVRFLCGNHDLPYLLDPRTDAYRRVRDASPGFSARARHRLEGILPRLTFTPALGLTAPDGRPLLATHAGLTARWAAWARGRLHALGEPVSGDWAADLTLLFSITPAPFGLMAGPARGGWDIPGILWADMGELEADPAAGLVQVVGHTPVPTVTRRGDLWFCDTFSTARDGGPLGDGGLLLLGADGFRVV